MRNNTLFALSLGFELGIMIVIPLISFLLLGIFLDKKLQTSPIFTLFLVFISLIVTFLDIRYLLLPFLNKADTAPKPQGIRAKYNQKVQNKKDIINNDK